MLDDANVIRQRDPQDFLGAIAVQPMQLTHDFGIASHSAFTKPISNVVFAGMGGSALVAELAHTWPTLKKPFIICRDYTLPAFVNSDTLAVCSSYSGNTEETLSALQDAKNKGAQVAIIAHAGKLADIARQDGYVFAQIPECAQPRAGVFYDYRALLEILVAAHLAPAKTINELGAIAGPLQKAAKAWAPSVPQASNLAKKLANEMIGKTPIIYAGPKMYPAAYKWKISVNENAKNTAWCNAYSEFSHNEFLGWTSHPIEKPFAVVDITSGFEHPHIQKRFDLTDRMLSGMRPHAITVDAQGQTMLEHLLYAMLLGDFATTYMGLLNGVNPAPVTYAEKFKLELAKQ